MWKSLSDWLFAVLNMSRELQEHRNAIRAMEERIRNIEEAIKLLAMEHRHARELEKSEREKLLLLQDQSAKVKSLTDARRRKKK